MTTRRLGLVVAGGAARGAYQAGVLRYLFCELPRHLGRPIWPDVVSGTSVGALNAVYAASRNAAGVERMSKVWRSLEISDVYRLRAFDMWSVVMSSFYSSGPFALLDARPLYRLVKREFPRLSLREAIDSGATRAFIISATELDTGYNTLFVDTATDDALFLPDPNVLVRRTEMSPRHALASAALPFLFAPVLVDGRFHVDGGLRQNTPVLPVARAGAHKVLVVGVQVETTAPKVRPDQPITPNLAFLSGKVLNALLLDPVERDLRGLDRTNRYLRWGHARYGEAFVDQASEDLSVQLVDFLRLGPSEDLGRVARATYQQSPPDVPGAVRSLLSLVADPANVGDSDLLSYIYFDRAFTAELEQLGFEDARRQEETIAAFLLDEG